MDKRTEDQRLIEQILTDYAKLAYAHADYERETVFDREQNRFLLMVHGWEGFRRVHHCSIHVDIIVGKFWIQCDNSERGVAMDLVDAGVPKDRIVLGFRSPAKRKLTEFAPA